MSTFLKCSGLTVRFGGVLAIDDVSLSIDSGGEVVGLVGPNGSGKSTFLNALSGLVPARGRVEVEGKPVSFGRPGVMARHGVFRTYQTPQVDAELTCIENVLVTSPDLALRGLVGAWPLRPAMWRREKDRWQAACDTLDRVGPGRQGQPSCRRSLLWRAPPARDRPCAHGQPAAPPDGRAGRRPEHHRDRPARRPPRPGRPPMGSAWSSSSTRSPSSNSSVTGSWCSSSATRSRPVSRRTCGWTLR